MKENKISRPLKKIFLCLIADKYDVRDTLDERDNLDVNEKERVSHELRMIIDRGLWSQNFYRGLTGFEFENEDGLYAYLEEVWQYVFNNGSMPDIDKHEC